MSAYSMVTSPGPAVHRTPDRRWLRLAIVAGALAWAGSIWALAAAGTYDTVTPAFLPQALAQDLVNLVVAAPTLVVCAILARRGSVRGLLVLLGVLGYTVYNYVIYVFSIPFGPLYPLWTAVLGLSLFAVIGGLRSLPAASIAARFRSERAARVAAWVLLVVAGLFALIWLREDVPALLAGTPQGSSVDLDLPTNPVHTLDYIFFLPSAFLVGTGLLHRRPFAYPATAAFLVFMIFTCVPIVVTPFVQAAIGQTPAWSLLGPIGALALVMLGSVLWLLATVTGKSEPADAATVRLGEGDGVAVEGEDKI
ncbi:hypothetical protein D6T64_20855 [Cryobacterium melibiosiphilum]|uniref:Uncharacterized protein n=1 Tax=Cryobacterium melibiosiphilum TaxID=995039 RepID=A0A3A5MGF4_9MICO|nr:hypothetical protein [Cryobacterium melibiosiphilum]RJT84616.1 hypothetical protein D6T64_20855 [Cryobacterium melibiosiphilum]